MYMISALLLVLVCFLSHPVEAVAKPSAKVDTIVVIYLENHSFDNLYGMFPGADGIANAKPDHYSQIDRTGKPYSSLPRVMDTRHEPAVPDERFPEKLPNRPFEISQYVPVEDKTGDLTHRFYQHQRQINGGLMNRFAEVSNAGGLTMGYYNGKELPLWDFARRYTLLDHFFAAAFGGSFLNHLWLACACTPHVDKPPSGNTVLLNAKGELVGDGSYTPDGYAVNALFSPYGPHRPDDTPSDKILSPLTMPTIGDRLSDKGISWAWYSGGWNDAVAGKPDPGFQFHHQPYIYFKRFADGSTDRHDHLKDELDFVDAIREGKLPAVSFYKPLGRYNEHPGYADLLAGEIATSRLLQMLEKSPQWPRMAVIVTYDEYGGYWDHVSPPKGDRWGPGSRVPAIVISPFSRRGAVDHRPYDTTSILKAVEKRFGLDPLGARDAGTADLLDTLDSGS